jgi:uncharacterized protein YjbJ (UPF0337 family)
MEQNILEGNWKQMKGEIRKQWGRLTDDEVAQLEGSTEKLVGKLQEKYGWTKKETEKQLREFSERHETHRRM